MSFRSKMIVALEDAEIEAGIVPGGAEEVVPATAPEVEVGTQEVVGNADEVEEMVAAVEEAETDMEALDDVQGIMEEAVEGGEGMSEQTAEMAEVAIESLCNRLGFGRDTKTMPAMESFGQTGTRLASTKIALENLGERIKRGWQALWNWLKQLWEKIKNFVSGLLKNRGMLQKHLEALAKRADEAKSKNLKAKEPTLKGSVAKAVSADGKADKGTALAIIASSNKLVDGSNAISPDLASINGAALDSAASMGDFVKKIGATATSKLGALGTGNKPEKAEEGFQYHGQLVGGKSIGIFSGEKEGQPELKLTVAQGKVAEEAAALSAADAAEVLKGAIDLVKNLAKFDKVSKDMQTASKHAMDAIQKHMAAVSKATDDEAAGKEVGKQVTAMREVTGIIAKLSLQFPTLAFQGAKAAGDYASASLANLKGEEAAKA